MLRDLAGLIAKASGVKVVFELPDAQEAAGYSKATFALMDGNKARDELGWSARMGISEGISRTLYVLRSLNNAGGC